MSSVQQLIDQAYTDCYVNSTQVPYTDGIVWFNRVLHDMENAMISFLQENEMILDFSTNLVANQNLYALPSGSSTANVSIPQLKKIIQVQMKYVNNATQKYVKALPVDFDQFNYSEERYETTQQNTQPRFMFRNDSIKVYPTPLENVTNGLKITYNYSSIDLLITDPESAIIIPRQFQSTIAVGIKKYIFASRGMINEKNDATAEYETEKKRFLRYLADRFIKPVAGTLPPLNSYMY